MLRWIRWVGKNPFRYGWCADILPFDQSKRGRYKTVTEYWRAEGTKGRREYLKTRGVLWRLGK